MAIVSFVHEALESMWLHDNDGWIPLTHRHQVWDVLYDLDAAADVPSLEDIGALSTDEQNHWFVTITVNNVEPCAAVTCYFYNGDCYQLDYREYNP